MPELDRVLADLSHLAESAPTEPPLPVERLAERARSRRRRRRLGTALAAAIVVVAAGLAGTVVLDDDAGDRVDVVAPPTSAPAGRSTTDELRVEPRVDLRDGSRVTVTGPFELDELLGVGQCGDEAWRAPDPLPWCEVLPGHRPGDTVLRVEVARTIETSNGVIDCAQRPGRCLLGVRTDGGDLLAPIDFDAALPPVAPPVVAIDRSALDDGERVTVSGSGFAGGAEGGITQCIGRPEEAALFGTSAAADRCDDLRAGRFLTDDAGDFRATYLAYSEVWFGDRWARCEPCVLVVKARRHVATVLPVEVAQRGPPRRPVVEIDPAGPYAPGQAVTLVGSGFQANQGNLQVGICGFRTDEPEREVQGDPRYGHTPCVYPLALRPATADEDGRLGVTDFMLPKEPFGFDCTAPDARCGLAMHPQEGSLPVFVTPFRITG